MPISPPSIQGYQSAAAIIAGAADLLRVPERVSVSEFARRHVVLSNPGGGYSGPWKDELAPFTVRPQDCLSSGDFEGVAIMGPSQVYKSTVANNWLGQQALYDPADLIWVQTDRMMMRNYVTGRVEPFIASIDELKARLSPDRSGDAIHSKVFRGMNAWFLWPTKNQLQSYPAPRFIVDDYDRFPDSIDGEGSVLELLAARQTTFEGSECGLVLSSPSKGVKRGIEALVSAGTDERFHWPCPHCGEYFTPDFSVHLAYDRDETDGAAAAEDRAAATAHLVCPSNGCVIEPKDKPAMLAGGVYAGPDQTVRPGGKVTGDLRPARWATFRWDGLMGARSWGGLARILVRALVRFEVAQDEEPLRVAWNTAGGKNYSSKVSQAETPTAEDLQKRADTYQLGQVPDWCQVLTAAVDVQGNRFEVEVKGWGPAFESAIVDRFAIHQLADGRTAVQPDKFPEHWQVLLERVIWARYPIADGQEMAIMSTAIDTGGLAGVTENSIKFWHDAVKAKVPPGAITLIKGGNNPRAKILPAPTPMEADSRGRPKKGGAVLWVPNVNRIKDILALRLARPEPGPGYIHTPADMDASHLAELAAEEKVGDRWEKIEARNETWDLEVYNLVAILRHLGEDCNLRLVPAWAKRPRPVTPAAAREGERAGASPSPLAPPPDHPHAKGKRKRRGVRGQIGG
jgi:phage terminase large subunit GpA-like protein